MNTQTMFRLLLIMCGVSSLAIAADLTSWENLSSLANGQKITVATTASKEAREGTFLRYDADSISLRIAAADVSIPRPDVNRILRKANKRARNALIGAAVGAGVALIADQTIGRYLRNQSNPDNARAAIWAAPIAVGAALGGLIPGSQTVYKRK